MNVEELIKVARTDYLDQFTEHFVSNNDLMIRSLSEAQRQACNRTNFIYDDETKDITQIKLRTGKASYDISDKITFIETGLFEGNLISFKSKQELDRSRPAWRTETEMSGKPVLGVVRGRKIRFIPAPISTDNGLIVSLEVFRLPLKDFSSSSDTPEIPAEYHRDLIYWAIYEAYSKNTENQDLNKANYYLDKFTNVFGEYTSSEVRLNQLEQDMNLSLRPVAYATNLTQTSDNDDWS